MIGLSVLFRAGWLYLKVEANPFLPGFRMIPSSRYRCQVSPRNGYACSWMWETPCDLDVAQWCRSRSCPWDLQSDSLLSSRWVWQLRVAWCSRRDVCNLVDVADLVERGVPLDDVSHLVEFQNWISSSVGTLSWLDSLLSIPLQSTSRMWRMSFPFCPWRSWEIRSCLVIIKHEDKGN